MAEDTGGIARLNYFNSQLLDATDFTVEQNYHVDMRRRHNRFVHTAGVAGGGLQVTKDGDKRVKVSAGMAIDSLGREIVFAADRLIDIDAVSAKANTTVFLTVAYVEKKALEVRDAGGGTLNQRRNIEQPAINFVDRKPPDDGAVIILAAIKLDGGGNIAEIENGVRALVGSVVDPRSELTVRKLNVTSELTARSMAVATAATITGGLRVDGVCDLRSSLSVGVNVSIASNLSVIGAASFASLNVAGSAGFSGQIGIGTATPSAGLEINKASTNDLALLLSSSGPGFGSGLVLKNTAKNAKSYGVYSGNDGKWHFADIDKSADLLIIDESGNVGIGVEKPEGKLDVRGAVIVKRVFPQEFDADARPRIPEPHLVKIGVNRLGKYGHDSIRGEPNLHVDAAGKVRIKQGFETPAFDIAERFRTVGQVEPGDVVVFDEHQQAVRRCETEADARVIGIISGEPGFILGVDENHLPVALCGRVMCRVDADIAPIGVGDLLTTSPTKGCAQKVLDLDRATGAVMGKSLGSLKQGKGEILVLVVLQ